MVALTYRATVDVPALRAYQVAELDDRIARVEQMTDEELMRVIRNGSGESTPPRLLTIGSG
jgi:hypothetical protein